MIFGLARFIDSGSQKENTSKDKTGRDVVVKRGKEVLFDDKIYFKARNEGVAKAGISVGRSVLALVFLLTSVLGSKGHVLVLASKEAYVRYVISSFVVDGIVGLVCEGCEIDGENASLENSVGVEGGIPIRLCFNTEEGETSGM